MSYNNNGLIYYPVNTYDVAKVTRKGSNDVGTLCGDNNMINKWAKYKPVILPNVIDTTYDLKGGTGSDKNEWKTTATWWKAADKKCGFTITKRTSGSALVTNWGTDWVYNPPTGGLAAPYRLIDFNYYQHNAVNPFSISNGGQYNEMTGHYEYYVNGDKDLIIVFSFAGTQSPYQLLVTDLLEGIYTLSDSIYCGALVVYGTSTYSGKNKIWATNPSPIGANPISSADGYGYWQRSLTIHHSQLPSITSGAGTINIYPFISATKYNSNRIYGSNEDAAWEKGVYACAVGEDSMTVYPVSITLIGNITLPDSSSCVYGINALTVKFNFSLENKSASSYGFTGYAKFYVLDADIDTGNVYSGEKKQGRRVLGTSNDGASMGFIVQGNSTNNYTHNTLLGISGSNPLTIGFDVVTYVQEYRAKHGSGLKAFVYFYVEFTGSPNANDGNAISQNPIEITGNY